MSKAENEVKSLFQQLKERLGIGEPRLIPRNALAGTQIITPGLYECRSCHWAFRYLGSDKWVGAYWRSEKDYEQTHDSLGEWGGYPRNLATEDLADGYADCFGKLVFLEPILQRSWNPI